MTSKRFFRADDGARYWVVATSMDEAKQTLASTHVEWDGEPVWSEMTREQADKQMCITDEDGRGRGRIPLSSCDLGEWFCSEW